MQIRTIDDNNTVFELVEIINDTPHCIVHGAMNKVSSFGEYGEGYWRCVSAISDQRDNLCRAGCIQETRLPAMESFCL